MEKIPQKAINVSNQAIGIGKVLRFTLDSIPTDIYNQLYSLNFRSKGLMRRRLVECRFHKKLPRLKLFYFGEVLVVLDKSGKVLAWTLVFGKNEDSTSKQLPLFVTAHFYTRKSCRNQKLGTTLAQSLKNIYSNEHNISVEPHDKPSERFFIKNNLR